MVNLRWFRSKNKRMFIIAGAVLLILMFLVFAIAPVPRNPKVYISFAFVWLGTIISVCIIYLVPRNRNHKRSIMFYAIGIYMAVTLILNTAFVSSFSLLSLIIIDFFLTSVILMFGMGLYFFVRQLDS